nr:beta-N-acetylhexosaminidase [Lysinibacillus timonensis]
MKKFLYLFPFLLVLLVGIYVFIQTSGSVNRRIELEHNEVEKSYTQKDFVKEIFTLSEQGRIPDVPYQVGVTKIDEINKALGKPKITDQTDLGQYASYPNDVTVGYQDILVFDLRSYNKQLQEIRLSDIKEVKGEPDEVTYYQDATVDQIILIYDVNSNYQLKWILPKPTEQEKNPVVHHISVYTVPPVSAEVHTLLRNMTLEEKIGQMIFAGVDGTSYDKHAESLIHQYTIGGIIFNKLNLSSPEQTVNYINKLKDENSLNPLPLFLGVDQEGGRVAKLPGNLTYIPDNLQIGKVSNPEFSYEIGRTLAKEVNAFGFNMNFAPILDINSNPHNPVIGDRSFGNNAQLVTKLGIATMKGIQSENTIAVVKHFPGHGDTATDSHLELPTVNKTLEELQQLELIPFKEAIHEGADVVMIAHILLPEIDEKNPSSMSEVIISDILRNQLHFEGVVMTDDMTMQAITNHYDIGLASVQSIRAGSDIIMIAHNYDNVSTVMKHIKDAVSTGEISEERINESVLRIIQLKQKYKLDDSLTKPVDIDLLNKEINNVLNRYK